MPATTSIQSVGVGSSSAATIAALNRAYNNPSTARVVTPSPLRSFSQQPSSLASGSYTTQNIAARFQNVPLPTTIRANSGLPLSPNFVTPPTAQISARAAQLEQQTTRYGSSRGSAMGGGFAAGYVAATAQDQATREAQRVAKREWYATPAGQKFRQLETDFINEYGGNNPVDSYIAALRTGETNGKYPALEDFSKLQAQQAYNAKLQDAIDAYQSKPENRRKTYDNAVANGQIQPPNGYHSEALDRYKKLYGDEKTVNDVKPYSDLTPNYSDLKPDIVYHPDGTVTYEKPGSDSSNIPLILGPKPGPPRPDLNEIGPENQFTNRVRIRFYSPNNRIYVEQDVLSFTMTPGPYGIEIKWDSNNSGPLVDPSTLTVSPINGSNTTPTNRVPAPNADPQIPTNPDGSADLAPFRPPESNPLDSLTAAPNDISQLLPMATPPLNQLGDLNAPQNLAAPLLDALASALPGGLPSPFPMNPAPLNGSALAPRIGSQGVGEKNPVQARSINATIIGTPATSPITTPTKAPLAQVPTPQSPTKIDNTTAAKTQEQIKTTPQTTPETEAKPRTCEDPCTQGLHDKLDANSKQVSITVKMFKACSTTGSDGTTSGDVSFEEKSIKVAANEADHYKLLYARIFALESANCDGNAIASIPEWWAVKVGADRPQLVVLFAEVLPTGKLTSSRWSLSIPHYNKPPGYKPSIPSYIKGNFRATLTLTDNSKLVVNADTKVEAQKVINRLKILIPVQYRTVNGKAIKPQITEDSESSFKKAKVVPMRADFYAKGKVDMKPTWTIKLRSKK